MRNMSVHSVAGVLSASLVAALVALAPMPALADDAVALTGDDDAVAVEESDYAGDSVDDEAEVLVYEESDVDEVDDEAASIKVVNPSDGDDSEASADVDLEDSKLETKTFEVTFRYDYAAQELKCLNEQRRANGKSELVMNYDLQLTAMKRAAESVLYFSHTRPNGTKCFTAFPWYPENAGENLAKGQTSPEQVTNSWMNSAGHRANILSSDYTAVGIGCIYYDGMYFWAQCFTDSTEGSSYVSVTSEKGTVTVEYSPDVVSASTVNKVKGTTSGSSSSSKSGTTQKLNSTTMFRLYNPWSGEHFYTSNLDEVDSCVCAGWNYEGVAWYAPKSSKSPVYRLYNPYTGDHHYTMVAAERASLIALGWSDEGTGWFSDDAKGTALYRQYNPYAQTGSHNYTTSIAENNSLVSAGWNAEGVGWWGVE